MYYIRICIPLNGDCKNVEQLMGEVKSDRLMRFKILIWLWATRRDLSPYARELRPRRVASVAGGDTSTLKRWLASNLVFYFRGSSLSLRWMQLSAARRGVPRRSPGSRIKPRLHRKHVRHTAPPRRSSLKRTNNTITFLEKKFCCKVKFFLKNPTTFPREADISNRFLDM